MTISPTKSAALPRITALLLLIEGLLLFAPTFILGAALNWPASLDEPASVILPLILEQFTAMLTGYGFYLGYSLLFYPVAYLTGRALVGTQTDHPLLRLADGFALLSTLARSLGIVRWLFAMPVLARLYVAPDATEQTRVTISIVYDTLNAYGGGVGELLGVSFFTTLWLILIGILILRSANAPKWAAYFGFVAAALLALNLVELVGIDLGPMITVSVTVLHFWMFAVAGWLWFTRGQSSRIR